MTAKRTADTSFGTLRDGSVRNTIPSAVTAREVSGANTVNTP
jgi:hypothetical protein